MAFVCFEERKALIKDQFLVPHRIEGSGMREEELRALLLQVEEANPEKALAKARSFEAIVAHAQLAPDIHDIFQDKILGYGLMAEQRDRWESKVKEDYLKEETSLLHAAWQEHGAYHALGDYGHTSPNSRLLLKEGFVGLLARVTQASKREGLLPHQRDFYLSCQIVLSAMQTAARRLADAIEPHNSENAEVLRRIADGAPRSTYEAMQLLILYFFMHEYVGGTRVRTLGRLDVLLYPFFREDLASGKATSEEIKELLKFFLHKFSAANVPFGLPFCLGGMDEEGKDVTNEMSFLIVEAYDELRIYSPKIHIRVSPETPKSFVLRVLDCIRHGNSSFVFINDAIAIKALGRVGIPESEGRDYVPIGCYEPAVWGVELGCTGNGGVNLPKAIEALFRTDPAIRTVCGDASGTPKSFEELLCEVERTITYMTNRALDYVVKIEKHYAKINPDPLLSCQYEHSVMTGIDVYDGGAKYNNSSLYFYSIASLVDSLCAIKRLVYDEKRFTLDELGSILRANWAGHEQLRSEMLRLPEKYGCGNAVADSLAVRFATHCASLLNNRPNGRGGVFKASLFSIDFCFHTGARTMATPDGRRAGDPLSKNMCATVGMDKNGITALIRSVTEIDHSLFPNGSVLDIMLHPSAVQGDEGLIAFHSLLSTYFKRGGFAMHGNVLDAEALKRAKAHPEECKSLQVRVCGWNAYFVNLSEKEQDAFIAQAEGKTL